MTWGLVAVAGATIVGGVVQSNAAGRAARAGERSSDAAIAEQQDARADFNAKTQSFVDTGTASSEALQRFLGFNANPEFASINADIDAQIAALNQQQVAPSTDPARTSNARLGGDITSAIDATSPESIFNADIQAQIQALEAQRGERLSGIDQFVQGERLQGLDEINPVVDFLRNEGFEQIQESAAAGGRLGAGGTLKDLTQFNTDLTSTIIPQLQNQRFNQLFNTASLGANAAAGQGTAGLQTASNVGNLLGQKGQAQAQGAINQSNAITGTLNNLAGAAGAFPGVFNSSPPPPPPQTTTQASPTEISNALTGPF